jgi:hypothetical protein
MNMEKASTGKAHFHQQHIIGSCKGPWTAESAALVGTSTSSKLGQLDGAMGDDRLGRSSERRVKRT